jgi:NADH dehydrogenase FAD-containing subunit
MTSVNFDTGSMKLTEIFIRLLRDVHKLAKKQKVVVLGSGWAGYRFLQDCDHEQYEINVVSPRNHMLFTPLLSSAAVGTVEIRSVCEPVRPLTIKKEGRFYQGGCKFRQSCFSSAHKKGSFFVDTLIATTTKKAQDIRVKVFYRNFPPLY